MKKMGLLELTCITAIMLILAVAVVLFKSVEAVAYMTDESIAVSQEEKENQKEEIKREMMKAAAEEGISGTMLIAIARAESGLGESKIAKEKNNLFGWTKNSGEYMSFESPVECIKHVAKAIGKRPHGTLEEVASWYNPAYADVWITVVKSCLYEESIIEEGRGDER